MSTQSDRDGVAHAKAGLEDCVLFVAVPAIIDALLKVPAPKGDGGSVTLMANGFNTAATAADKIAVLVAKVASQDVPEVWVGAVAERAGEVVVAVEEDLEHGAAVFGTARTILDTLAAALNDAHKKHSDAQDPLHRARSAADHADFWSARRLWLAGADLLLSALDNAERRQDGRQRSHLLSRPGARTPVEQRQPSNSDKILVGESAAPGGPHDLNMILNENEPSGFGMLIIFAWAEPPAWREPGVA